MGTDARWWLRTVPRAVLTALAVVVVVVALTADGSGSVAGRLGGDLPAFHGAGRIVADGDAADLYDPARQIEAQAGLLRGDDAAVLFTYPAVLAAPYAALAGPGYQWTYLVHTAVMALAVVVAARLLADRMPLLAGRDWIPLGLAVTFTSLPMFIGVANGQNAALTLLAASAVWVCACDRRDVAAGFVAGLALLKPQYGVVLVGLLALSGRWRAVGAAAGGAAVVWGGSALVAGAGWTGRWLDLVGSMSEVDKGANLENEVSWFGLAERALGQGSTGAKVVAGVAIAATLGVLLWSLRGLEVPDPRVPAVVLPSMLLVAPHALYYDAGILVVALAALLPTVGAPGRWWVAAGWWAGGLAHLLAAGLGVEPVALLVVGTWAWALWAIHGGAARDADRAGAVAVPAA